VDITPRHESALLPKKTRQWPPLTVRGRAVFLPDPAAHNQPARYLPLCKDKGLARKCRKCNQVIWKEHQDGTRGERLLRVWDECEKRGRRTT
jgi:hypothetical protein